MSGSIIPWWGKANSLPPLSRFTEYSRWADDLVQTLMIENRSDADYILENLSEFTLHDHASVLILKAHETTRVRVKILEKRSSFDFV